MPLAAASVPILLVCCAGFGATGCRLRAAWRDRRRADAQAYATDPQPRELIAYGFAAMCFLVVGIGAFIATTERL